jgi:hypothetical protein
MLPLSAVGWAAFWIALFPLSVEVATSARPTVLESEAFPETLLDEVQKTFTVGGKRIPPEIFRDFGDGDLADSGSIWVTVDVHAAVGSSVKARHASRLGDLDSNQDWRSQSPLFYR